MPKLVSNTLDKSKLWGSIVGACSGYYWQADGGSNQKCKVGVYGDALNKFVTTEPNDTGRTGNAKCVINHRTKVAFDAFPHLITYYNARKALSDPSSGLWDLAFAITIPGSPDPAWTTYLTNYKAAMLDHHGTTIQADVASARI